MRTVTPCSHYTHISAQQVRWPDELNNQDWDVPSTVITPTQGLSSTLTSTLKRSIFALSRKGTGEGSAAGL